MRATRTSDSRQWSVRRLFAVYVVVTLLPVLVLALILTQLLRREAEQHGTSEGIARARLVARTAVAPLLDGGPTTALAASEYNRLERSVRAAISEQQVLRLRLRDLDGRIVFPATAKADAEPVDDDALRAAGGATVANLTRLNADDPSLDAGPRVIEIYMPLDSVQSGRRTGVLEMYLPYDPIAAATAKGQRTMYFVLVAGLALLWLCLIAVSASVVRRLRRETAAHAYLAEHDALTEVPNRVRFSRTIASLTPRADESLVVVLVTIGRYRQVADALGQANADAVLHTLARRLTDFTGDVERVGRLGGSDFAAAAIVPDVELDDWLRRLLAKTREPITVDGLPIPVDIAMGYEITEGVTADPPDAESVSTLMAHAAVALSAAQRTSVPLVRYSPEHDHHDATALTLVAEIGRAIANDELVLHYQPKYDIASGHLSSVEALVRWQHPTRGLLYPNAFLDAVEQTELIEDLTTWVLRQACQATERLPVSVRVAVNISARSLARADFAAHVIQTVARQNVAPARLMLEVTETAVVTDPRRATSTLMQLRDQGFAISIDDFGTGQTSLSQLVGMPIDELKIDRSFVSDAVGKPRNTAIVRAVIDLGHSLGISVTAEGVENRFILQLLAELGCDVAQGYYFSRPVPLDDLLPAPGTAPNAGDEVRPPLQPAR